MANFLKFISLLSTFFVISVQYGNSQNFPNNYIPFRSQKLPKEVLDKIITSYKTMAKERVIENKAVKKTFVADITANTKAIALLDTNKLFMLNDSISIYLNSLVKLIQKSNPEISNREILVFTYRDDEVNAANYGPGMIVVNLGDIAKFNTEEELIFTLSHEISHECLDHVFKGIQKDAELENDPEYKKKMSKLRYSTYLKNKQLENLQTRTLAKSHLHDRKRELEADSLGILLYKNVLLDKSHALRHMHLLDSSEVPFFIFPLELKKKLDPENSFFDDTWLTSRSSSYSWNPDSTLWKIPDSLKTHPDCIKRLERLQIISANFTTQQTRPQATFEKIRHLARLELLDHLITTKQYDLSLFYSLQLHHHYPDNIYVKNILLNSLIEIANSLKDHTFSRRVDFPNYFYYPLFNELLHFIHNVNSRDLKKMSIAFFKGNLQNIQNDSFTAYNAILIKSWETPPEKQKELIDVYLKVFNDKHYLKELKKKFDPKYKK